MKELKIGYLALSKLSWKTPKIEGLAKETAKELARMPGCRLVAPEGLVTSEKEAQAGGRVPGFYTSNFDEMKIRGNPLTIRFEAPVKNLIDAIMLKGFEHHYTVIHADVKEELLQYCAWMDIEPVMPEVK